jgi:hypothetical protein
MQPEQTETRTRKWLKGVLLSGAILFVALLAAYSLDLGMRRRTVFHDRSAFVDNIPAAGNPQYHLMRNTNFFEPGALPPDLDLPSIGGGRMLHLSQFRGVKPVVLVFSSFT